MVTEIDGISADTIEKQLGRLRSSPLFSHSRRYPMFLDYVVRKKLDGKADELKERTVGIEVFGRASDYDLNADPIVRVTAGEVRRRLAQYYYQGEHQRELRIELNPGSYIPEFRLADPAAAPVENAAALQAPDIDENLVPAASTDPVELLPPLSIAATPVAWNEVQPTNWRRVSAGLAIALALAVIAAIIPRLHRATATDLFWQPIVDANGPVLISVGSVVAMVNNNAVAPPPWTVSGHPLSSDPIAVSDATALSSIQKVLSARSKTSILESSTSTSFSDLQKGPIVLISGFNNQWTMRLTDPLRFHLVRTSTNDYSIQDRKAPDNRWSINTSQPFVKIDNDYGIVARFHDRTTDQVVIAAAGIGENGTIAASRVLTDDRYLSDLKRDNLLPRVDQNFEAIVETQIIDGRPGPPRIIASYIW